MPNAVTTNNDTGRVVSPDAHNVFADKTVNFASEDTYLEGTIMATRKVASSITPAADGGNTGNGTVDQAAPAEGPVVPLVGTYVLECIEAVTNGGIFQLKDPNGAIVGPYLPLTVGAGANTTFEVAGLTFRVTDGGTDFAAGDSFDLPVVADGDVVPFATDGVGGAQVPEFVMPYELYRASAGDSAARVLTSGKVNASRLVIHADGDDSNLTTDHLAQLRSAGIESEPITQLGEYDNTAS